MGRVLKKEDLRSFLERLIKKYEVVAPVTTDMTRFKHVTNVDEIDLKAGNPFFPIKKYFLPKEEPILKIEKGTTKKIDVKKEKRIIFGARLCDINGISILDNMFLYHKYPDERYKMRREKTIIIGVNCITPPSEFCFCGSMDLKKEAYDLLLHEREQDYYIDAMTDSGAKLVKHLPPAEFDVPLPKTPKKLTKKDLNKFMDKKYWEKDTGLCVSCQRCTMLCPTCFCFDIFDIVNPATRIGERKRRIDSCHSEDFTKVAGGHIFRQTRLQRYRHRVMHKLQFYEDRKKRSMCTGCGRCIEYCHSRIDFVKTINEDFK